VAAACMTTPGTQASIYARSNLIHLIRSPSRYAVKSPRGSGLYRHVAYRLGPGGTVPPPGMQLRRTRAASKVHRKVRCDSGESIRVITEESHDRRTFLSLGLALLLANPSKKARGPFSSSRLGTGGPNVINARIYYSAG
jgi:hypothetical protein